MRLTSRFGYVNQIRRDRPLTHEELMHHVPGIFGEDKHTSRSQNYTYIPTITVLESLQREGFQPFFACQTRVRDPGRRGYTKHMLRLRRTGEINGQHVPEIILLNSHDGSSSYQMLPGYFRAICTNGLVCGQSLGEVRVPHRGNVVDRVIEGAYEVVGVFDRIRGMTAEQRLAERQLKTKPLLKSLESWLREKMKTLSRHSELAKAFAYALNQWPALTYYADDGWAEADNNIAENALRMVSLGRKNYLFFGSDHGGERGALLYSLIGTCKLNGVEPESYLRYVLDVIADWPINRVGELLPWRVALPTE